MMAILKIDSCNKTFATRWTEIILIITYHLSTAGRMYNI